MRVFLPLFLLALSAVANTSFAAAPRIDEQALAEMRRGQTTFGEIVRRHGRPNFGSKMWDSRTAAYSYGEGWSPAALTAMGAALGSSGADTVVLHFDEKDVLVDYKINRGAKPGETPGTYRYVEPSFGGSKPAPAAKPAAAATPVVPTVRYLEPARAGTAPPSATGPAPAQAAAAGGAASNPATAAQPAAVQVIKPEPRSDSLPWWLPSSSTRGDRY